jgi:tripartite-type tricarboxylate transporter receptor subunit TctC
MSKAFAAVLALAGLTFFPQLHAQTFPSKPVRFIIPFAPGGPTDILGRVAAAQLSAAWGVGVIPDNRAGASGTLGAEQCAKAPPDGHTLCIMSVAQAIAPSISRNVPFDPVRDFAHVRLIATLPSLLLVHPSMPERSVRDFLALAKARPGALSYASSGSGSSSHMLMELLKLSGNVNLVHVPYKGTGPALIDQVSGQIEAGFAAIVAALPHAQTGKLRTLAVSTRERFPRLPDVPTIDEAGLKGFDGGSWLGVAAPAATPREIVDRTNMELSKAFSAASMKEKVLQLGGTPMHGTPQEFSAFVRNETAKWAKVVSVAGIRAE